MHFSLTINLSCRISHVYLIFSSKRSKLIYMFYTWHSFKDILILATNFILSECFNVITKECSYNLSLFNLQSLCLTFPVGTYEKKSIPFYKIPSTRKRAKITKISAQIILCSNSLTVRSIWQLKKKRR